MVSTRLHTALVLVFAFILAGQINLTVPQHDTAVGNIPARLAEGDSPHING